MVCRFELGSLRHELTPVDNRFITDYLPKAQGLAVQVYLYGLMQCYHASLRDISIAEALGISEEAVEKAFSYWQGEGLVRIVSGEPFTVEYASLSASDAREATPAKYANLVRSINQLTAPRQFGVHELKQVYDWVELYSLSEGAVLTLVSYCLEKKKNCPVGYMSSVAGSWALANVHTQKEAMDYIADADVRAHGANAILKAWHLRRPPTEDEMARYNRWTKDWGFTSDTIEKVLPRMSQTAAPSFEKLDGMLKELFEADKKTAAAILRDDAEQGAKQAFAEAIFRRAGKAERPTRSQSNQLAMYVNDFSMPAELIEFAADLAKGANEPFGYMKKLLNGWHEQNIVSVGNAKAAYEGQRTAAPAGKTPKGAPKYTNEELKKFEINLDGDA